MPFFANGFFGPAPGSEKGKINGDDLARSVTLGTLVTPILTLLLLFLQQVALNIHIFDGALSPGAITAISGALSAIIAVLDLFVHRSNQQDPHPTGRGK